MNGTISLQWRFQNFLAAGAQPGHWNVDWGTFKKLCVPSLFLIEARYTLRTTGTTHGRKMVVNNCRQVAQLSQRDRAAGWVSYGQQWKTGTGRQYLRTI